jgi:hypothetical protein
VGGVEAGRRLEGAWRDPRRQLVQDRVRDLVLIGQPDDSRRRRGDQEPAERAVHSGVGDIDEPFALGALHESRPQPFPGLGRRSDRLAQPLFDVVVACTHRGVHDRGSRLSMRLKVRPGAASSFLRRRFVAQLRLALGSDAGIRLGHRHGDTAALPVVVDRDPEQPGPHPDSARGGTGYADNAASIVSWKRSSAHS